MYGSSLKTLQTFKELSGYGKGYPNNLLGYCLPGHFSLM